MDLTPININAYLLSLPFLQSLHLQYCGSSRFSFLERLKNSLMISGVFIVQVVKWETEVADPSKNTSWQKV